MLASYPGSFSREPGYEANIQFGIPTVTDGYIVQCALFRVPTCVGCITATFLPVLVMPLKSLPTTDEVATETLDGATVAAILPELDPIIDFSEPIGGFPEMIGVADSCIEVILFASVLGEVIEAVRGRECCSLVWSTSGAWSEDIWGSDIDRECFRRDWSSLAGSEVVGSGVKGGFGGLCSLCDGFLLEGGVSERPLSKDDLSTPSGDKAFVVSELWSGEALASFSCGRLGQALGRVSCLNDATTATEDESR